MSNRDKSQKKEKNKQNVVSDNGTVYTSAELMLSDCREDYYRLINSYDKMYDKVNIALAFCGVVLFLIVSKFDFFKLLEIGKTDSLASVIQLICSLISTLCIVSCTMMFLLLLISRKMTFFNSEDINNERIYRLPNDKAALWVISKYTSAINKNRPILMKKQRRFDIAIILMLISVFVYLIQLSIEKGGI